MTYIGHPSDLNCGGVNSTAINDYNDYRGVCKNVGSSQVWIIATGRKGAWE